MTISSEDMMHGAAMLQILESIEKEHSELHFKLQSNVSRSGYLLEVFRRNNEPSVKIGLYIKTSRKRLSSWSYTFTRAHQEEVLDLWGRCDNVFCLFIAGEDGIALVSYDLLKEVLDDHFDESEWVRVSRKLNENYRVGGKDGRLDSPLPRNAFPNQINQYIDTAIKNNEKVHDPKAANMTGLVRRIFRVFKK